MTFVKTLKTAALATALVVATAGASMAAQWAWVDQDANVRANHHQFAPVVNWVGEGQQVKIVGQWNNWYRIQIPGQDGWVRKNVVDAFPNNGPFPGNGGSFCVNGQQAQFCINANF